MKKILIDLTHIKLANINSSISIYAFRFLSSIKKEDRKIYTLLIYKDVESYIQKNYPGFEYLCYGFYQIPIFRHFVRFLKSRYVYKKLVESSNCKCVFISTDITFHSCIKLKCKKVSVIHDLKVLKVKCNNIQQWWKFSIFNWYYSHLIETSDIVIAISNYTKTDILKFFPWANENKIRVIYNSVPLIKEADRPLGAEYLENYILYINTLCEYKNISTLLKAYYNISKKIKNKLVVVGRDTDYWNNEMLPLIEQKGLGTRIVHFQNLRNEELRWLYSHASLFVSPSLHEGFGYTPIEAAIYCCPVLCSTCEALPDTTQGLVTYYEPATDDKILAEKILELLNTPPTKEQLNIISTTFLNLYSPKTQWEHIYQLLIEK